MSLLAGQQLRTLARTSTHNKEHKGGTGDTVLPKACPSYDDVSSTCPKKTTQTPLPVWIAKCEDAKCAVGGGRTHFHCNDLTCFSRGLLCDKAAFTCEKRANAVRHAASHTSRARAHSPLGQTWNILLERNAMSSRPPNKAKQTPFRTRIDDANNAPAQQHPPIGSVHWRTRLLIGKVGTSAAILESSIQQLHTSWHIGPPRAMRIAHNPGTSQPERGHTIQFNPCEEGASIWYGLCTSSCGPVDVFGDKGIGCTVKWFELSHRGQWKGSPADFYELSDNAQPQLLDAMTDWGHLLVYDQENRLFVDVKDGTFEPEVDAASKGEQALLDHPAHTDDTTTQPATREDLLVANTIVPTHVLHFVDRLGQPTNPTRCRKVAGRLVPSSRSHTDNDHERSSLDGPDAIQVQDTQPNDRRLRRRSGRSGSSVFPQHGALSARGHEI